MLGKKLVHQPVHNVGALVFKNRIVRDLAWVISSPPLISGDFNDTHWWSHQDCLNEYLACLPALKTLDKDTSPLIAHLDQIKSRRLGFRFEALIAYWLKISPNYKLLAKNIQIIKEGHTFGEVDFIIQDSHTHKIIHLEVSVKFYLGSPPYKNPYCWFGTNTQDQLAKKVEHLKSHQTQLGKVHAPFLEELGFEINQQHCILKGRLFYPLSEDTSPQDVATNHLRGRWIQDTEKYKMTLLYPIDKTKWLAELNHNDIDESLLQTGFSRLKWPQCYVGVYRSSSGEYEEINRVFYLPDTFKFPQAN